MPGQTPALAFPKDNLGTGALSSAVTLVSADAEGWVGPSLAQGWLCSPLLWTYLLARSPLSTELPFGNNK